MRQACSQWPELVLILGQSCRCIEDLMLKPELLLRLPPSYTNWHRWYSRLHPNLQIYIWDILNIRHIQNFGDKIWWCSRYLRYPSPRIASYICPFVCPLVTSIWEGVFCIWVMYLVYVFFSGWSIWYFRLSSCILWWYLNYNSEFGIRNLELCIWWMVYLSKFYRRFEKYFITMFLFSTNKLKRCKELSFVRKVE